MEFSKQIKTSNTDEWYTSEKDVELIVPYLVKRGYQKILCPFDKVSSNYVKVLTRHGFDVEYGHIEDGKDFFEQNLQGYDAIVSNPPFSKRQEVLERLFSSKVPFAMITNINGIFDNRRRWKLFRDNKFELLVPLGRMKFTDMNGVSGDSPNFQSVYVCSGISDHQIEFVEYVTC